MIPMTDEELKAELDRDLMLLHKMRNTVVIIIGVILIALYACVIYPLI